MKTIGENIRFYREAAKMTQDELAEAASVNRVTLAKYEAGKSIPGSKIIMRLAAALHVRTNLLLGTDDSEMTDEERELWEAREAARNDPDRMMLFKLAKNGSSKDVKQVAAVISAFRATNPDFYDGDDPA